MKTNTSLLQLDVSSLASFVKSDLNTQIQSLNEHGILVDYDCLEDRLINLFFIKGFFVEQIYSKSENRVIENIPFRHGYRIRDYIEIKQTIVAKKMAEKSNCCNDN